MENEKIFRRGYKEGYEDDEPACAFKLNLSRAIKVDSLSYHENETVFVCYIKRLIKPDATIFYGFNFRYLQSE